MSEFWRSDSTSRSTAGNIATSAPPSRTPYWPRSNPPVQVMLHEAAWYPTHFFWSPRDSSLLRHFLEGVVPLKRHMICQAWPLHLHRPHRQLSFCHLRSSSGTTLLLSMAYPIMFDFLEICFSRHILNFDVTSEPHGYLRSVFSISWSDFQQIFRYGE